MVKLDVIVTRIGDNGQTTLADGARRPKHDLRIDAIGAVEEANAAIGLARVDVPDWEIHEILGRIQHDLFDLGADLARPEGAGLRLSAAQVERLETELERYRGSLPPAPSFVLPGGTVHAARLHLARTVVRRAERRVAELGADEALNPEVLRYLNRLSDHLFILCRVLNDHGARDVLWQPGANAGGEG